MEMTQSIQLKQCRGKKSCCDIHKIVLMCHICQETIKAIIVYTHYIDIILI